MESNRRSFLRVLTRVLIGSGGYVVPGDIGEEIVQALNRATARRKEQITTCPYIFVLERKIAGPQLGLDITPYLR